MMQQYLIYLTICAASAFEHSPGFFMSRMAMARGRPTSFRPGVMLQLQRPWHQRFMAPTARMPYVVYRAPAPRYSIKNYKPSTRFYPTWKTTRMPAHTKPDQEFVRAVSEPAVDGGAIHTIPAPNLSLSEKPIVVMDQGKQNTPTGPPQHTNQQPYEVTETPLDKAVNQISAKIEHPAGFSKSNSAPITAPEAQSLVSNNQGYHLAQGFSHPNIGHQQSIPVEINHQQLTHGFVQQFPQDIQHQALIAQPTTLVQNIVPQPFGNADQFVAQASLIPQQFSMPGTQEMLHANQDGFLISSPSALYQPDASFIQKLQQQLIQRFPGLEFVPFATQFQSQFATQPVVKPQPFALKDEQPSQVTKLTPSSFVSNENKNVVQRGTQEGIATLIPPSAINNTTEKPFQVTTPTPLNVTEAIVPQETKPPSTTTTTVKYVEASTESQNVTPIYYAQVGQSVGNIVASGFYSSLNEVRAASVQAENPEPKLQENITTSTLSPDLKPYFVQKTEHVPNQTVTELKPVLGISFAKPAKSDSVNVAYTLVRADDKELKLAKDGSVYAGQIVEATVSEDHDFNKEKANLISRRAPIRIYTEKKESTTTTKAPSKLALIKSRMPQKSKLTFDDKTGEPVLRIYASYVDSPLQKELLASKLSAVKHVREVARKQDTGDWKLTLPLEAVQAADKAVGFDSNQVTNFGLKIQSRGE